MEKLKSFFKTPQGAAFFGALSVGVVAHLFALVNVIHNYDSIHYMPYGQGSGVYSGRFMLSVLGGLAEKMGGNTNLPLFNGLVFLLLLALSAALLVSTLSIRGWGRAAMVGMLVAVFPTATSTMIHRFTAIYYGISVLMAVLAVWVMGRSKWAVVLSALCTAVSLGIYQALVPVTIATMVLVLIQRVLKGEADLKAIVKQGVLDCAALVLGLLLYFVLMKLSLKLWNTELIDYQGINEMGRLSLSALPGLIWSALKTVIFLPVRDYCAVTDTIILKLAYLLLGGGTVVMVGYLLITRVKKPLMVLAVVALCLLFLLGVNFIYIQCPASSIYTLMVYSFVLLPCAPVVIYECLPETLPKKDLARKLLTLCLSVVIFSYGYLANSNYTAIYYADQQVENYLTTMVAQIRMTDGFDTEKQWAFLGGISDPLMQFSWQKEMTFGGFTGPQDMLSCHSTFSWLEHYLGYRPQMADQQRLDALWELDQVKEMPVWPNAGSIRAIGDTMVIKCAPSK